MTWAEGDVRVDDANLHYYRRGRGPTVVLAHGALDDGRCWTRIAEAGHNVRREAYDEYVTATREFLSRA